MSTPDELPTARDVFVARQPIFRADHSVLGYELLHRADGTAGEAGEGSLAGMSFQVLVNSLLTIGLDELIGNRLAFINFPQELILDGSAALLSPERIVIEIHESVRPDPAILRACRSLREQGFRLALDDVVGLEGFEPFLELVSFAKVDVLGRSREELAKLVEELRPFRLHLLAEKVETEEMHALCVDLGFDLFQGFHFFRPETLSRRDLSSDSVAVIRLLNLLQDIHVTDRIVEEAFRSDPALSYKLLRMVNAAALGGRGIRSIGHALRLLGREPLHRWLAMLLVSQGGDGTGVRRELLKSSLLRARMCELAATQVRTAVMRHLPSEGTFFLVGLFSHIDVLLRRPMEAILSRIELTRDVEEALLWRMGPAGQALKGIEAYEAGAWEDAEVELGRLGLPPDDIPALYLDALTWAGSRMGIHEE